MNQQFIKKCFMVASLLAAFSLNAIGEYRHNLQATSETYSDLGNDSHAIKLIDAWLRLYQTIECSIEQEGDKEVIAWLARQEKTNAPQVALMGLEILKRENDWTCKTFMIGELSVLKNTDKAPLVEEIRNQLQKLPRKENGDVRSDGYIFLQMSATVLSSLGTESDKQLLLSLSHGCPDQLKIRISNEMQKLDERLAKEKASRYTLNSRGGQTVQASDSGSAENARTQSAIVVTLFSNRWTWIIGGGLILIGGSLVARRIISHPNRE